MTVSHHSHRSWLPHLAVLAAVAMMLSLLPFAGSALAQDEVPDPNDACPEEPPASDYTDRDEIPDVHLRNVDCVTARGIALGFTDNTYRPTLAVRRDQMASFIARTLEEAGFPLPAASEHEGFSDTANNEHEDAIRQLAAAEIVLGGPEGLPPTAYGPERLVRRDQMASFLIRAAEFAFEEEFGSTDQQFTDVPPSNTHYQNVNAAAEFGLAQGGPGQLPATQYGPALNTRRDQMASFLARLLAFLEGPGPVLPGPISAITLEQTDDTNVVGEDHIVTATATDADDVAVGDADVRFEVTRDGEVVDLGEDATATTTAGGEATLTYTSDVPGVDTIVVCANADGTEPADCDDADFTSTELTKTWVEATAVTAIALEQAEDTNVVGEDHIVTATATGVDDVAVGAAEVRFEVTRDGEVVDLGEDATATTNASGEATLTYTSDVAGVDTIVVCVNEEGDAPATCDAADFTSTELTKTWVLAEGQTFELTPEEAVNPVGTEHTLTVNATDEGGEPVADDTAVRFEVYDPETGAFVEGDVIATAAGAATFTYAGPEDTAGDDARDDVIVACASETRCITDTAIDIDPITGVVDNLREDVQTDTARKSWAERTLATLELAPEEDANSLAQDSHTVTATARDQFGDPIASGDDVTFQVFRDEVEAADTDDDFGFVEVTPGGNVIPVVPDDAATEDVDETGTAVFTYDAPATAADDTIIACVETENVADGDDDAVCATATEDDPETPDVIEPGEVVVDEDEDEALVATATKQWADAELTLALAPATDTNPIGTDHTVVATITDQFGDPVEAQDVQFEVYRDVTEPGDTQVTLFTPVLGLTPEPETDAAGEATLVYSSAVPAQDEIVACVLGETDGVPETTCASLGGAADEVFVNPANVTDATAQKVWVAPAEATDAVYTDGEILDIDAALNDLVAQFAEEFVSFNYLATDEFTVNDVAVSEEVFEGAVQDTLDDEDAVHTLDVDYNADNPFAPSVFDLTTDADAVVAGPEAEITSADNTNFVLAFDDDDLDCESVDADAADGFEDFGFDADDEDILTVVCDEATDTVTVTFDGPLEAGESVTLLAGSVNDLVGNPGPAEDLVYTVA